jgi:hypothetical protein
MPTSREAVRNCSVSSDPWRHRRIFVHCTALPLGAAEIEAPDADRHRHARRPAARQKRRHNFLWIAMPVPLLLVRERRFGRLRLFAALLLAAALLEACGPSQQAPAAQAPHAGGGAPPAMPVGVQVVELRTVPILIESVGQAEGSK